MKLIGMLIILGGILFLLYTLAGDQFELQGGGDNVKIEAMQAADDALEKLKGKSNRTKERIKELEQ